MKVIKPGLIESSCAEGIVGEFKTFDSEELNSKIKPADDYAGLLTQFHLLLEDIEHKGFQIKQVVDVNQQLIEENSLLKERVDNLEGQLEGMDEFIDRYQERCRNGG